MANTNKGRKLFVCATPQPIDLTEAEFEALAWVEVGHVGNIGQSGTQTNILTYNELSTIVAQKQKGVSNAGDPMVEVARTPGDPGQKILHDAGLTNFQYAFKWEDRDAPGPDFTNTIYYNRGLVTGPVRPNGGVEAFILEQYTFGLNQIETVVDPKSTLPPAPPVNTAPPTITGTAQVGQTLTASDGTWTGSPPPVFTYNWQQDAAGNGVFVDTVPAGIAKTFAVPAGAVGNAIQVQVKATNATGTQTTPSAPTALVIA